MQNASRRIAVNLALLTVMAAVGSMAWTQVSTKPPTTAVASSATVAKSNLAQFQATALKTTASIQASSTDKQAMVRAVRTKSTDAASALLLKNGFSASQLQVAKIDLVDNTGGGAGGGSIAKVKITITADCCPMVITITISF